MKRNPILQALGAECEQDSTWDLPSAAIFAMSIDSPHAATLVAAAHRLYEIAAEARRAGLLSGPALGLDADVTALEHAVLRGTVSHPIFAEASALLDERRLIFPRLN